MTRHYTVQPGDTLSGIARDHGVDDWQDIVRANPSVIIGGDPRTMQPGNILHIPEEEVVEPPPPNPSPPDGAPEPSDPIRLTDESNVVIERLIISDTPASLEGALTLIRCENITIRDLVFKNIGMKSIYAYDSSRVFVENVTFLNGGRNYVQFNGVQDGHVIDCVGSNPLGETIAEDFVSVYKSNGTQASPIVIARNEFSGGGPSWAGSGIMLGDGDGSWQVAVDNVLTDPGQVGIGIAGGQHVTVQNNHVTSQSYAWTNVGIYVWSNDQASGPCGHHTIRDNTVEWYHRDGYRHDFWNGQNCSDLTIEGNSWQ